MFTKKAFALLQIVRYNNAVMASLGVALGFWLSDARGGAVSFFLLCLASFCATGFGNAVNDIMDLATDRISHPARPLPSGKLSTAEVRVFATVLGVTSAIAGIIVSPLHGAATVVPLALLTIYSWRLKGTPVAGNALVSVLVAYPVIFGSLNAPHGARLIVPAALAFLLNLCREIVKDVQDLPGDRVAGLRTSAILPATTLRLIIDCASVACGGAILVPWLLGHFGLGYLGTCLVVVVPLHLAWLLPVHRAGWLDRLGRVSLLIKLEMLAGLAALAVDRIRW